MKYLRGKKGLTVFLIVVLSIFIFHYIDPVLATSTGMCANPYIMYDYAEEYYCNLESVSESHCCPADNETYDNPGAPISQDDCEYNFLYPSGTSTDKCTTYGCCFDETEQYCDEASLEGYCWYYGGQWNNTCAQMTECDTGCCYYAYGVSNVSILSSRGYCDALAGSFNESITDETTCSAYTGDTTTSTAACADGIDNDADGLIDYGSDPGCDSSDDADETDVDGGACADGTDNDGDGYIDLDDAGCCSDSTVSSEELCELAVCSDSTLIATECNCYSGTEADGTACAVNNYCCSGVCQSTSCDTTTTGECTPGDREYCGVDAFGCLMYYTCDDASAWGDCAALDSCSQGIEVCDNVIDDDNDGEINCEDLDCFEVKCGDSGDSSNCNSQGYQKSDGTFVCCSSTDVNDCDDDGTVDTCGPCDCLEQPLTPAITDIAFTQGEAKLTVEWSLNCNVDFNVLRCAGDDCDEFTDYIIIDNLDNVRTYDDVNIGANERYCYLIEALYDNSTYSDAFCVDDSGDEICQQISTVEFCLDETGDLEGSLIYRAGCDSENKIDYIENCRSSQGTDYFCVGPDTYEQTECIEQSECDLCGDPLGIYADDTSVIASGVLGTDTSCFEIESCYFDYTYSNVDAFKECRDISSCYDYSSEYACAGQDSEYSNNKCLRRDCEWESIDTTLGTGICKETMDEFIQCGMCDTSIFNYILDACTLDKCRYYGDSCYRSSLTLTCTDTSNIGCTDFSTTEECGSNSVSVDVTYEGSTRTAGTHELLTESNDALGLGLCYWDSTNGCYKDADGDANADAGQQDYVSPVTTIISDDKVSAINLTVLVQDLEEDGTQGSGVEATYYCLAEEDEESCYPDTLFPTTSNIGYLELGEGGGYHTIYYYSEDYSNNLEVVTPFSVEVDKSAPVITIEYIVTPDTTDYTDSSITFEVTLDEEAYCTDSFEDVTTSEIDNELNNHYVVKYEELTDGYYLYSVNCTDLYGNMAYESVLARVDADIVLFDPEPEIITDQSTVDLIVKTLYDATCAFEPNEEVSRFEAMSYRFDKEDVGSYYLHTYPSYTLGSNDMYFFDVKCEMTTLGRNSDDEIQFVFDNTAPDTLMVDTFGNSLNYSAFYGGEDMDIYLRCEDSPKDGFGCNTTYYCMNTLECTPDQVVDYSQPLEYNLSETPQIFVCYSSVENTIYSMGGKNETTQCTELQVDYYDPSLTVDDLYDGMVVYVEELAVEGDVDDPDASSDGGTEPYNTVTIMLTTADGNYYEYTDIEANNEFSFDVNLTLASYDYGVEDDNSTNETTTTYDYNTVSIYGIDRSGATTEIETYRIFYTGDFPEDAIQIVTPYTGVSSSPEFEFKIQTYLDASVCGYSKNDASLENSIAFDQTNSNTFEVNYTLDSALESVPEYVYVKCLLDNNQTYAQTFMLMFDNTTPVIEELYLNNSDGKTPPNIIEAPLDAMFMIETDDYARCKYGTSSSQSYDTGMYKFDNYDDAIFSTQNTHTIEDLTDETSYTYYFVCQNGAYLNSDSTSLSFTVNTSMASGMYMIEPGKTSETNVRLYIQTTRTASECYYGTSSEDVSTQMTAVTEKEYSTDYFTLTHGTYTYYFSCSFVDGTKTDYFEVVIDTTPPVVESVEDGSISYSNTTLYARWNATDDLTDVEEFNVSIGTMPRYNDVVDWFITDNESASLQNLSLLNQSTYYWNVKAKNEVGLWSDIFSSSGVFIEATASGAAPNISTIGDTDAYKVHCSNGVQDDDESDIDCGGLDCNTCAAGSACTASTDCASKNCLTNICQESTCDDLLQNQGESDVDCGGTNCEYCLVGQVCTYDSDCETYYCSNHACAVPSCYDGVMNGDEEGIDCGGSCSDYCTTTDDQSDPTCSDGRQNQDEDGVDCGGPCDEECPEEGGTLGTTVFGIFMWFIMFIIAGFVIAGGIYGYNEYYIPKYGGEKIDVQGFINKNFGPLLAKLGIKLKPGKKPFTMGPMNKQSFGKGKVPQTSRRPLVFGKQQKPQAPVQNQFMQKKQREFNAKKRYDQQKKSIREKLFGLFDDKSKKSQSKQNNGLEKLKLKQESKPVQKIDVKPQVKQQETTPQQVKQVSQPKPTQKAKKKKSKPKKKSALDDLATLTKSKKSSKDVLSDLSKLAKKKK